MLQLCKYIIYIYIIYIYNILYIIVTPKESDSVATLCTRLSLTCVNRTISVHFFPCQIAGLSVTQRFHLPAACHEQVSRYIFLFMQSDWHCTRKNAYRTHHRYYSGFWCLAGQIGQFLPCILEKRRVHRWGCERLPHQIGGWKCNRGGRFHFAFFTFSVTSIFKKKRPLNHKARGMNRGWVWMEDMEGPGLF